MLDSSSSSHCMGDERNLRVGGDSASGLMDNGRFMLFNSRAFHALLISLVKK